MALVVASAAKGGCGHGGGLTVAKAEEVAGVAEEAVAAKRSVRDGVVGM